jgi:hypothetical protein
MGTSEGIGTMTTMRELEQDIRAEVRERAAELREDVYPEDTLTEMVDSSVPIYTSDLFDVANDDRSLMLDEPELGPAFDGAPTPMNIIAANIYERLNVAAFDEWNDVKDDEDEDATV